jgi:ribosomal protein L24
VTANKGDTVIICAGHYAGQLGTLLDDARTNCDVVRVRVSGDDVVMRTWMFQLEVE